MSDLISREVAIKHLTKARMIGDSRPMAEIFAELPSVQPKAKTGRWMWQSDSTSRSFPHDKILRCSQCNDWQTYGETSFCPNCGARMGVDE